ncbi:hypothetical protein [Aurantiacibacter gilvus]|uniref:META domain-containing protein n=1 Tax=Aurantiacibacter gilvus TaxID=3139141 RepID=A0ABU9IGP7_9SPHN
MIRTCCATALLALAGCYPAPADDPQPAEAPEATQAEPRTAEAPAPDTLAGEFRVAGIDGEPLDAPQGIALSVDEDVIDLLPCAGLVWDYTYMDGALETQRRQIDPVGTLCRPTPETVLAAEAIDAATQAIRTPSNGIRLSGGGHSLTLYSQ